ncbi:hypothetical protein [Variovorax rhizosphaerae]|uniref:Uncharacterized protein n=1 Tax=Variovorax rhizosphaerae TaxID=1836200 RepID=A0ABU8WMM2_9BURK
MFGIIRAPAVTPKVARMQEALRVEVDHHEGIAARRQQDADLHQNGDEGQQDDEDNQGSPAQAPPRTRAFPLAGGTGKTGAIATRMA